MKPFFRPLLILTVLYLLLDDFLIAFIGIKLAKKHMKNILRIVYAGFVNNRT